MSIQTNTDLPDDRSSLHGTYRHSAQEIGSTSRFLRALRQDLPEFVTFHSARRGTRVI
jgi:hypothetical protein